MNSHISLEETTIEVISKQTDLYRIVTEDPDNWHLVANCDISQGELLTLPGFLSLIDVHDTEFIDIVLKETQERKRVYTSIYAVPSNISCVPDTLEIPWCFMNHSCEPNTCDQWDDKGISEFRATTKITKGEELTYDYNLEQYDYRSPFECRCGTETCRGMIYGFNGLSSEEKKRLLVNASPFIQDKYRSLSIKENVDFSSNE